MIDLPGRVEEKATKSHQERTLALGEVGVQLLELHRAQVAGLRPSSRSNRPVGQAQARVGGPTETVGLGCRPDRHRQRGTLSFQDSGWGGSCAGFKPMFADGARAAIECAKIPAAAQRAGCTEVTGAART
jgi:hypothetical protein